MSKRIAALALFTGMTLNAPAAVQLTELSPPLAIGAGAEVDNELGLGIVAIDFNLDGQVDSRLTYSVYQIQAFLNRPTRTLIRSVFYPWTTNVYGPVGALPLGAVIGSNLVTSVDTNVYIWHTGDTNWDDETQSYGDHKSIGLMITDPNIPGFPPVVSGDLADKEGIVAVEFVIGTNKHYGYIHFDFRQEAGWYHAAGGYILGWAYETEPNTPIVAAPIAVPPTPFRLGVQKQSEGVFDLNWRATPGATYRVQGAPAMAEPFTDFTPDIIPPSGVNASPVEEVVTFYGMQDFPSYFWRVVRTR